MVGITASDYASEYKKFQAKRKTRMDQTRYMTKIRIPTQTKTKKQYCGNCLKQLEVGEMPCKQCGVTTKPRSRRK